MSDIFISYASADRARVMPLVDELRRRDWSVWWDRSIRPGKTWDQVIEAALDEARCVIVLWSRDSVRSDWVRTEAEEARRRGILIPVLLDDVIIPLAFRQIQAANLIQWPGVIPNPEFDKLAEAVTKILSKDVLRVPETTARPATPLSPLPQPNPVPVTIGRRHVWSFGRPRRTNALIGATLLVCVAGSAWYFASGRRERPVSREVSKSADSSPRTPGQTRNNLKDGLKYVFIPAGGFVMGCSPGDTECGSDESPPHAEQIANGFWLGQTEVTQAAWNKVNIGDNPSSFKGDQLPVESVDWKQASAYCRAIAGRLPTEIEWEYAARGGSTGPRYGALDAIAWYFANSGMTTHPVALKHPNAFGLYDMLGNVWEWTSDNYDPEHKTASGGSWFNGAAYVRVSHRYGVVPADRYDGLGFRCVLETH